MSCEQLKILFENGAEGGDLLLGCVLTKSTGRCPITGLAESVYRAIWESLKTVPLASPSQLSSQAAK